MLQEFINGITSTYFLVEVLPYWVMFALSPLVAWGVCKFFGERW